MTIGIRRQEKPLSQPETEHRVTILEPNKRIRVLDLPELYAYRDLFRFLTWRHIKVQYAQSTLGIGWAIIQPVFSMLVFTIVFGKMAKISSDGVPYAVFSLVALVPWTYFSNAVTEGTNSLVSNTNMLTKVYFPRLIIPLSSVLAKLVDFFIGMIIVVGLLLWYGMMPTLGVLMLPYLIILMMLSAAGMGLWATSLAIQYRDVKYGLNFGIQLLMYAAPVVYPASLIPERWQYLYALNPMVGIIEGFRSALLGTNPMPWDFIAIGTATSLVLFLSGARYFRGKEKIFADVA